MELLSFLGTLPKRRKDLEGRAQELLSGRSSVEEMEEEMRDRNLALVERLRREKIRFTEFQRVAADETVTAALAGIMFGYKSKKLKDSQFAEATRSLPYLWKLFNDIQKSINTGRLESVNDYGEVDDLLYNALLDDPDRYEMLAEELGDFDDELIEGRLEGEMGVATWEGAVGRLDRYLVSPIYGFAASGAMLLAATQGQTMMMRVARADKRTCEDCLNYAAQGWVPIGTLPPPGQMCACHDRCRCYIEYR
jgi:hypothetical protein